MHDGLMKSLFAKIMLAQVVAVVLALLIVLAFTRLSLDRGFTRFLENQEGEILAHLAPVLSVIYQQRGGWSFLIDDPENWRLILQRSSRLAGRPGRPGPRHAPPPRRGPGADDGEPGLRWLRTLDRLSLRDRLFLLDETQQLVAGLHLHRHGDRAADINLDELRLEAITVDEQTVGYVGFAPIRHQRPPEVKQFLKGQVEAHLTALLVALAIVSVLSYALARHLSRPVARLDATVDSLSRGEYERRAEVESGDEIGRLAGNVNHLAATLEKNRSARRRWMSDIAHELRTPVAILKGEIEALRDGLRTPGKQTLASLADEVDHLSKLVDDLQSLALADAGALNLERSDIDLATLVQQAANAYNDRLGTRGIHLSLDAGAELVVRADARRLRQLLNNLLENCVRYTRAGGEVVLSASRHPEGILVSVTDNGPGVSDQVREQLFERFYRAEASRARASGGSGLGLAICRSIAEAHGGRIWAESNPSGGLSVHVLLPA